MEREEDADEGAEDEAVVVVVEAGVGQADEVAVMPLVLCATE